MLRRIPNGTGNNLILPETGMRSRVVTRGFRRIHGSSPVFFVLVLHKTHVSSYSGKHQSVGDPRSSPRRRIRVLISSSRNKSPTRPRCCHGRLRRTPTPKPEAAVKANPEGSQVGEESAIRK
ncbi:uncharacterized protein LOC119765557 [Culex quinquefasciatus]|nr:uncharacterized protein LOC119765557 [Culex quinquefasciatus]XP_038105599.1 uncharacterized protein LOC119765557 [Culex quinquefasciatus]